VKQETNNYLAYLFYQDQASVAQTGAEGEYYDTLGVYYYNLYRGDTERAHASYSLIPLRQNAMKIAAYGEHPEQQEQLWQLAAEALPEIGIGFAGIRNPTAVQVNRIIRLPLMTC